jgi:hypothetical protein
MTPYMQIARRRSDRRPKGNAWRPWMPGPETGYRVYSNTGAGDAINYSTPIAATTDLTYTTTPLSYPGTWSFGVRAFDLATGLEEENVDCALTLILDSGGNDITSRPAPPLAIRAFALAGGSVRVEWAYPRTTGPKAPTGVNVYLGLDAGPLCSLSSVRSARVTRAYSGSVWLTKGVSSPGRSSKRGAGAQSWHGALGGSANYSRAVATVLYSSAIANSLVANLSGLMDGVTYVIGVRAYNATAEEPNTMTVTVTADATGPGPVDSLTAVAAV